MRRSRCEPGPRRSSARHPRLHPKGPQCCRILQDGDELGDPQLVETAFAAVERNLFVIGEAAKDLPDDLLALAPEIDWKAVKGLRDVLGHEYFRVAAKVVHASVR